MTEAQPRKAAISAQPSEHSPASHIATEKWIAEMGLLQEKLKQHGIAQTKVGLEIEFDLSSGEKKVSTKTTDRCNALVRGELAKGVGGFEKQRREQRAQQMCRFNPAEFLMYELHDVNPRTKDILEYSFGKGELGSGYYDNPGVFEMRLKPASPQQLCKNRQIVLEEMHKLMAQYGLSHHKSGPSYHISLSFWKDDKDNVLSTASPSHRSTGKHIAEGMLRGFFDGFGLIRDPRHRWMPSSLGLSFKRTDFFRLANGRLEMRLPHDTVEYQHPESLITLAMAGAAYGLQAHAKDSLHGLVPANDVMRGIFKQKGSGAPHILHLLNSSYVLPNADANDNTRTLGCDINYMRMALADICVEMRLIERSNHELYKALWHAGHNALEHKDMPKTDYEGKALYEEYSGKITQALGHFKWHDANGIFPDTLKHLNGVIGMDGAHDSFHIRPYYWLDKASPGETMAQMLKSEVLHSSFSPPLLQELKEEMYKEYGAPSHLEKMQCKERLQAVARAADELRHGNGHKL